MLSDQRRRAARSILGKKLVRLVVGESRTSSSSVEGMVVLVFDDGSSYEMYSGAHITLTKNAGGCSTARQIEGVVKAAWPDHEFESVSLEDTP
jgi:hypothetical protein